MSHARFDADGLDAALQALDDPAVPQRRHAFRVNMRAAVHIDHPMELYCELVDISVLGARFDRELPCTPGVDITFRLEIPTYGASLKPEELELQAEVLRSDYGNTGVRFVNLTRSQAGEVQALVQEQQRMMLAALRNNGEAWWAKKSDTRHSHRRHGRYA